jgi:hypothetical protein
MILSAASGFSPANAKPGHHNCHSKGVEDGKNNPIDQSQIDNKCYLNGFMKGCLSIEGNTEDICNSDEDTGG